MAEEESNGMQNFLKLVDSIAPHNVLMKVIQSVQPKPKEAVKPSDDAAAEEAAKAELQYQQKPWTRPQPLERYVTGEVSQQQQLLSFYKQGVQAVGERYRDGVIPDTRDARLVTVGLGDVWDDVSGQVVPAKTEQVPEGLPFANKRKSGEKYWPDQPRKNIVTDFF